MSEHTQTAALKPCPFCGNDGEFFEPFDETTVIACNKCNAQGGYYGGNDSTQPHEAVSFWNQRVPAVNQKLLDAARAMVAAEDLPVEGGQGFANYKAAFEPAIEGLRAAIKGAEAAQ